MKQHTYLAIDLKSFYASSGAAGEAGPTEHENLVVADESRTDKTICLAVTPTLRTMTSRPRALFECGSASVRSMPGGQEPARRAGALTGSSHQFSSCGATLLAVDS